MLKAGRTSSRARVLSSKQVFRSNVFTVNSDEVIEPGNVRVHREVVRHSGSVVILPVDDSRKPVRVLLIRQFRYPVNGRIWELPAGRIDSGETPLRGAQRELREETGFLAGRWQQALFFYVSPGFLDESMKVFLARDLKKGKAQPEDDERISLRFFSLTQAIRMVLSGRILDAKTIAALLWLEKKFARR